MASPQEQTSWLTESAGVFVTSDRVVTLGGDDAVSWLNGQVTADVRTLPPGEAAYALAVTLKGRVQSDLWAVQAPRGLAIVLPDNCAERALESFEKHIIMEDVELQPESGLRVVTIQGPKAGDVIDQWGGSAARYACARLPPRVGFDVWLSESEFAEQVAALTKVARSLGGGAVDQAGWAHAHVVLGTPRAGVDFGLESYPQEAGLKARAVSFSKGCYTGQEVVYMLEKRGQVARRLVQLVQLPGSALTPPPGSAVFDGEGARIGQVTSATQTGSKGVALAYLKRAHSELMTRVRIDSTDWEVHYVIGASDAGCPIVASA